MSIDRSEAVARDVPLRWHERVGSTQDEARALLDGGRRGATVPVPFAVATSDQRTGRGRLGRVWSLPPGRGVALTVVHRPRAGLDALSWYPLVAALGALAAVRELTGGDREAGDAAPVGCKWPNDLLDASGRKLAGILVERAAGGELLVGIGMNLRAPVHDAAGQEMPHAVALDELAAAGDRGPRRAATTPREVAERLVGHLVGELALLDAADGDALGSGQAARYRESCVTLGSSVRIDGVSPRKGRGVTGQAIGIDERGRLLVRTADGATSAVDVGDVHHVRRADAGTAQRAGGEAEERT